MPGYSYLTIRRKIGQAIKVHEMFSKIGGSKRIMRIKDFTWSYISRLNEKERQYDKNSDMEIIMKNKIEIIQRFDKIFNKIIQLRNELKQQKEEKTITTTIEELTNMGKLLQNKQNKSMKYSELKREWLKSRNQ
ncbi:unnamed protein product [Rhizophagus irregularis]|nr:unnamed protein product [Rhizophagus irregularis]